MAKLAELKALAVDLRKRLRQVDQLTGRSSERDRDTQRKRELRAASKEVQIPACDDAERRTLLESDDTEWLRYYFAELFWYPFTMQQLEMIEAIRNAIRYGGDESLAASCGEGKTKIFERMLLKYTLSGVISFSVLFAATGSGRPRLAVASSQWPAGDPDSRKEYTRTARSRLIISQARTALQWRSSEYQWRQVKQNLELFSDGALPGVFEELRLMFRPKVSLGSRLTALSR